ncbi:MAG: VCBS repeat-containing protein, partial [Verrucomicrobiales bacterium]|nr:VCBS repeat-containing protein [Verrucomicrobiales bacterium]
LDFTRCALFVDFDNDGDQDVVLGLSWHLIFLRNDGPLAGGGMKFTPRFRSACPGMVYALAAADYDNDGDVDIYASGRYAKETLESEQQILGLPVPYHDANNGGRSSLWRNEGAMVFKDVTEETGVDANNTRFTLAASWDDYDNDGDQDLYIANDFGRNNLYRNNGKGADGLVTFTDVAGAAGVEDLGAGMSVGWGDANGDGLMDVYVANMYSSAGHRVTEQAAFMEGVNQKTLAAFKRHARGNSLYVNNGDGTFRDATYPAGVNMGRWAWSSLFADLNNDGRQDLVVANGFISAESEDDL